MSLSKLFSMQSLLIAFILVSISACSSNYGKKETTVAKPAAKPPITVAKKPAVKPPMTIQTHTPTKAVSTTVKKTMDKAITAQPPRPPKIITLYVGPKKVPCTGVASKMCYSVKYGPTGNKQLFYSDIKGFNYQPNYIYTLKVSKSKRANVPADASAYTYHLIKVVAKDPFNVQ